MRNKTLKSVIATFALVAGLVVWPAASTCVEAAENESPCRHGRLALTKLDESWDFVDYSIHVYESYATYSCSICNDYSETIHTLKHEPHYDEDGDGMCPCGTYFY